MRINFLKEDERLKQFKTRFPINIHADIKAEESESQKALDLADQKDFLTLLSRKLREKNLDVLATLQADAKIMHDVLTPSIKLYKDKDAKIHLTEIKEKLEEQKELSDLPDVLWLFGSNDLTQVDFIATLYHRLAKHKRPKVYVCSFGGHGTKDGPIFGLSEAETFSARLRDLGVLVDVIERHSTNTGENVTFTEEIIKKKITEKIVKEKIEKGEGEEIVNNMKHEDVVLISGTPSALWRQLLTVGKQSTLLWKKIICVSPVKYGENLIDQYYSSIPAALINFLYALREVATFLSYTLNKDFLLPIKITNEEKFKACIEVAIKYYNFLTNQNLKGEEFAKQFILLNTTQSAAYPRKLTKQEIKALNISLLVNYVEPIGDYFRDAFFKTETLWMKQLSPHLTVREQAEIVDPQKTMGRYGLINLHRFYHKPSNSNHQGKSIDHCSISKGKCML